MSNISLISASYETVADLRLDQDIVISVDLTDVLHDSIVHKSADIGKYATVMLENHAINDVAIDGEGDEKVIFTLPDQIEGKSRHFMIRLDSPKQCSYDFLEKDGTQVLLQSSSGKLLSVDESMTRCITMLDCYEVAQSPTKLFVDVGSSLSTVSLHRDSLV